MRTPPPVLTLALAAALVTAPLLLSSCASDGKARAHRHYYSPGYHGYYHRPWGYRPIYIGGGDGEVDPDWGVEPDIPVAMPQPDLGMPDFWGGDFDMGGFDF